MKFQEAWASIAQQNSIYRVLLVALSIVTITVSAALFKAATKPPLVINSDVSEKVPKLTNAQQTKEEIETFIDLSLTDYFSNENLRNTQYLDPALSERRKSERLELGKKQISRKLVIYEIEVELDSGLGKVKADLILSTGNIKSAISYPLDVKVQTTNRTRSNPYGLVVTEISSDIADNQDKEPK